MKPENFDFGGGARETILHPAVLVVMLFTILLVLILPRKYVIVPFLMTLFLVPLGQQIFFAGAHWLVLRIVILAGCLRLVITKFGRNEQIVNGGLNGLDKLFIIWALYRGIAPMLLFHVGGAVALQIAMWIQTFGAYFVLRHLVQYEEDITRAAKTFALLVVVFGACMLNEQVGNVNIFGYLGGVPIIPAVRDGQIRAQAAFGHPILAGCFGATLVPLFFWLWKGGKSKTAAVFGMLGSTVMVLTSASSTPVLAYLGGVGAIFLWPIRRSMRLVRWGIVLMLAGLALMMKAPVWFVVAHLNVIGGSGGYDRAYLIDVFIRHFWDWWLIGTDQTGNWGFWMWDLSNQFAAEGETGGLIVFICFIAMIVKGFSSLGKMRSQVKGEKKQEWLYWSLCAVMFTHVLAYFGVSYWDQTIVWWFAFLSMISAATPCSKKCARKSWVTESKYSAVLEPGPDDRLWYPI